MGRLVAFRGRQLTGNYRFVKLCCELCIANLLSRPNISRNIGRDKCVWLDGRCAKHQTICFVTASIAATASLLSATQPLAAQMRFRSQHSGKGIK